MANSLKFEKDTKVLSKIYKNESTYYSETAEDQGLK